MSVQGEEAELLRHFHRLSKAQKDAVLARAEELWLQQHGIATGDRSGDEPS